MEYNEINMPVASAYNIAELFLIFIKFWKHKVMIPAEIIKIPNNSNFEIFKSKINQANITIKIGADPRATG